MTFKRGLKLISYKLQDNQISKLKQNQDFQFIYKVTDVIDQKARHDAVASGHVFPLFFYHFQDFASLQYFLMRGGSVLLFCVAAIMDTQTLEWYFIVKTNQAMP